MITGRHGEYDFGSYKRGEAWARQAGWLDEVDDLILCNDSCFGPVGSFAPMFERMEARHLDFGAPPTAGNSIRICKASSWC